MNLIERHSARTLVSPVMIMVLDGWIDAGAAAEGAIGHILSSTQAEPYASVNTDTLLDQRSRRPSLLINDGVHEGLTWPRIEMFALNDSGGNDILLLIGPEPDMNWRTFASDIVDFALLEKVQMLVGFGGFPAPAPHTRPVRLASTASSRELASKIGFVGGSIEVPAGVQAVLEEGFSSVGIPSIGLWARVPHYASGMPYPAASAALVEALNTIAGLTFDTTNLWNAADATRIKVDKLIAQSEEHSEMVHLLESSIDAAEGNAMNLSNMPTGDEIADELERFLREERDQEK
ncbi:MAG: PAC2 family protein [Acidimicrobiales bacterium]|nr:PAC2 family protein [Acidimicrobiales bacterium]